MIQNTSLSPHCHEKIWSNSSNQMDETTGHEDYGDEALPSRHIILRKVNSFTF